eukprot:g14169.t1
MAIREGIRVTAPGHLYHGLAKAGGILYRFDAEEISPPVQQVGGGAALPPPLPKEAEEQKAEEREEADDAPTSGAVTKPPLPAAPSQIPAAALPVPSPALPPPPHEGTLSTPHQGGALPSPVPEHSPDDWMGLISDGVCKDDKPEMWTCKKEKIHGQADQRQYNVYRFKAGIFKINAQLLVPPNTYIIGNENPNPELLDVESEAKVAAVEAASAGGNVLNGAVTLPFDLDHPENLIHPDHSKQTLFLATAGAVNADDKYCKQDDLFHGNANQRVGLVLSSNTGVVDVSYQGIDVIRPEDNGSLCGGAAFETKGCIQFDCKGKLNTGGSDGKASENVVLKNIRVNGFHYKADRAKIGVLVSGNDGHLNAKGNRDPPFYHHPNDVRASQVAVWVPQSRDGSVSKNILVKNMVVLSLQGDGINFHAGVENAVLENSYIQNTGDDIFAIWGAKNDSKQVLMKNTVGYNPGVMRPGWYGQCIATYGIYTAYFKNHVCKSPLLTKITRFPWGDRHQLNSVSMLGMADSFDAAYKEGSTLKFKNYFFGDLANPAAKHADHGKGPPDVKNLKEGEAIDRFWWSDTDDRVPVRAPFYKWADKDLKTWGVKVHFKEKWDEAAELRFDAWMTEKRTPGWHPLEERASTKLLSTAATGRNSGGAGPGAPSRAPLMWRPSTGRCAGAPPLSDTPVVNGVKGVFLVISDWGFTEGFSKGNPGGGCQRNVAKVAAKWLKDNKYEHLLRFVLSPGDNFYRGLDNTTDPKTGVARTFQHHWEQVYPNSLTCVPWYAVLGNHDFGDWNSFELETRNCYATTTDPENPGLLDYTNCHILNGRLNEVKTNRACVRGIIGARGEVPDGWAMPAPSYAVTAWEKSLDLTIVATDGNYLWRDNYPFSAWEKTTNGAQREKDLTPRMKESVEVLQEQVDRGKELPKNLIIMGHYPWVHERMSKAHARDAREGSKTLYGDVVAKVPEGKNVYYFGGHVHHTDDPEHMEPEYQPGEVHHYLAGATGGFCDSDCKKGEAGVIFGLVMQDGSISLKRVPGCGPGHVDVGDWSIKRDSEDDNQGELIQMPECKVVK